MTSPIRQVLATLPSGESDPNHALNDSELGRYLRDHCAHKNEVARNARHALRDDLFRDGGVEHMKRKIDEIFRDPTVRELRKQMVEFTRFSNSLKRIVGELSTVYAEPAVRSVGGTPENQAKYAAVVESLNLDEQLEYVNQMLNLHRAVLVGPRVRTSIEGTHTLVLDIVTPANARCVMHPNDNTHVVGWLTRVSFRTQRGKPIREPVWQLWTDHESEFLDDQMMPITGTRVEHKLGMSRWVPITYSASAIPDFWPGEEGEDLIAAQITIWLANILLLKETKSSTKQPFISGDVSTMARNQAMDSEVPIQAPEGVAVSTTDMGTDPSVFIATADHALERAGNNYGLSMAALKHQGVQSAEARELMLAPVRERRARQVKIFRRFERQLANTIARVVEEYAPEFKFKLVDWRVDFGEPQVLLSKKERLEIFEKERGMGLDNTVAFRMRENPDETAEMAWNSIIRNIETETMRNEALRPLQAISGSLGANTPDNNSPTGGVSQENGIGHHTAGMSEPNA